jgi:TolB-like protein/class 3 adenylate cyclase
VPVQPVERKLAAIFAADIAGYSRLMAHDEVGTLTRLKACRAIIDGLIASHRGRIFNTAGDSVVADFASAVDAVQCAVAVQAAIATENAGHPTHEPMHFRIGVHVGDVIIDGENLLGDGVNIAARMEGLAEPGAICVSAVVRDQVGNKLPVAFDDLSDQQVKNIAQAVRVYRVRMDKPAAHPVADLPLPEKPSIAVLPFQNMSGDPEQEYFADGMVEEIITALSRIRWLFVIARNSTFTYKGKAVDVKQVGRELGVRYLLEGSVRKGGNRVRITGQLIEAETGAHLWADRFDGSMEDVFDLQDQVANSVAGVIEPALQAAEARRSTNRPTSDLTAYDLYLRALQMFSSMTREGFQGALQLLEQAVVLDPLYGSALALAAVCHFQLHLNGWASDPDTSRSRGVSHAREALRAAVDDPSVPVNASVALSYFGEDVQAAMALMDRGLHANPSFAYGWLWSGVLRMMAGLPDTAIEHLGRCSRLNPRERVLAALTPMGICYLFKREFDKAVAILQASIQERPGYAQSYRALAACYAHMGRLDEAREVVQRLRAMTPIVVPPTMPIRNPEYLELFLSGLRLAAGETTERDPPPHRNPHRR